MEPVIAHDVRAEMKGLSELRIDSSTTEEQAGASMRQLAAFNGCTVGLVRFSGQTPWERHTEDELLHILEGDVEVTLLCDPVPVRLTVKQGNVVVVPRGIWHRQLAHERVTLLFVTGETDGSTAEDPR